MSEGPYRDLGEGFARLTGVEGVRRAPSRIETVEDALLELVRNAVDSGAGNVYVASVLHARRYRELIVLDDGEGIPEQYRETIFEPGVTTRHLSPSRLAGRTHGAGLSLHHIKEAALSAEVLSTGSTGSPTSIRTVFNTRTLPERSLQSGHDSKKPRRNSRSNLWATLEDLASTPGAPGIFYGSPASVTSLMVHNHIIQEASSIAELDSWCEENLGGGLSKRTLQRVRKGLVAPAERVVKREEAKKSGGDSRAESEPSRAFGGGRLTLDERDLSQIRSIVERAAGESYLEVGEIGCESREGEIIIRARIYEAEEEYED
ncbi:ATP-binding protein [Rubrobacter aplysinae]|uniref:ATP-binding protein n=1 Tax=Rubrobacter aplysinae TaxID=909625 RepID=UPI00069F8343|nr:ATP-binding protein [Rubrobacter aplysinae]